MRYYFFTGSPIGVGSDGVVCVCLSVCLPVSVRVRVRVKRKSPKTSIYQRRVSTLTLQSPRNQLLLAAELVARCCVCVLRWSDGSRESVWEPLRYRQRTKPTGRSEEVRGARALERVLVYVTHAKMRPLIAP